MDDHQLRVLLEQHQQKMLGIVTTYQEKMDDKMQIVLGHTQDIPKMKEDITAMKADIAEMKPKIEAIEEKLEQVDFKLEATFEKVGEIAEDVTIIKETVKDHEVRLQKIEARF